MWKGGVKMAEHQCHKDIAGIIKDGLQEKPNIRIIPSSHCDPEGGKELPLLCQEFNSNESIRLKIYSRPDLLILKSDNAVKVIIEIEESDFTPVNIFGKFLAAANASYYLENKNQHKKFADSVLFIQYINTRHSKEKYKKIETRIQDILSKIDALTKIKVYRLYNEDEKNKIVNEISEFLG